jgi:hypothetical protein
LEFIVPKQYDKLLRKMNTALIVEPRDMKRIPLIINHFLFTLGPNWKIVFYCGTGLKSKWSSKVNKEVEIRELYVSNFTASQYSDLLKSRMLWDTLYGEFVLVFQTDAWIMNEPPYTIDYFLFRNKSYIGSNMCYKWEAIEFKTRFWNYNGGLSLRKRKDMIKIIDAFPPVATLDHNEQSILKTYPIETYPEDVYFVEACNRLGLEMGDCDEEFNLFSLHTIFYPIAFGTHKPSEYVRSELIKLYPEIQTAYI